MHAVVVIVKLRDTEAAEGEVRDRVAPEVSGAPGFVAGYWTRDGDAGHGFVVFESEEAAKGAAERAGSAPAENWTTESVEVREVVAHA